MTTGYLRSAGVRDQAFTAIIGYLRTLSVAPLSFNSVTLSNGRIILTASSTILNSTSVFTTGNYSITPPVGSSTPTITDIILGTNTISIGLSSDLLQNGTYSISVAANTARDNSTGAGNNSISFNFTGAGSGPTILNCTSLNSNLIQIIFNKSINPTTLITSNFSINNSLSIYGITIIDGKTITINTSTQKNGILYTVASNNIKDLSGNSSNLTSYFTGIGQTFSIIANYIGNNQFKVIFSEPMDITTIGTASAYHIDGNILINNVTVVDNKTVILSTSNITPGQKYTIRVN